MARNTKTVRKRFDYRQCDDFAAYLNHMARQGWHFKEWRAGLVFEKGAPENAVYTVEIFTDGTAHDMQPSYKAMNFAEYCEAAGWKLIDQRLKWCILKRTREDAVPIFTDEERFENVKSVTNSGPGKLLWVELLILVLMFGMILYSPKVYLFSLSQILWSVYWPMTFLRDLHQILAYNRWCKEFETRLEHGEPLHFRRQRNSALTWVLAGAPLAISIAYFLNFDFFSIKLVWIITCIFVVLTVLLSYLPRRLRMDTVSCQLINVLYWTFFAMYMVSILVIASYQDYQKQDLAQSVPMKDQGVYSRESNRSTTFFGTKRTFELHLDGYQHHYTVYESQMDWVMDTVWDDVSGKIDGPWTDCAEQWEADAAYRTLNGYIVRYEGRILVFSRIEVLSQEQIDTIVAALKEG